MSWAQDAPILTAGFTRSFGNAQLAKRLVYTYMAAAGLDTTWSGVSVTATGAVQGATVVGTTSVSSVSGQIGVGDFASATAYLKNDGGEMQLVMAGDVTTQYQVLVSATSIDQIFICATGENTTTLTANLADAWSVKDSAGDLIVVDTRTGARVITLAGGVAADSVQIGGVASAKVGFFATTPVVKQAALTTQLTTITPADAEGTPDYAIAAITQVTPFGFASAQEAITALYVIKNLQVRLAEVEARLEAYGLVVAN